MLRVEFTSAAVADVRAFRAFEQRQILDGIEAQLRYEPTRETHNRKRLRRNQLAEWELRIGRFRVFYDVDERQRLVKIEAVGYKQGNRLFVHGQEYQL
jgi:mRNA-degrading endonuclease RelE of RelBE toxin-antitoxin system